MPKYVNNGTSVVVVGDIRIEAGQTIETRIWLPAPLPTGVVKLADAPFLDSVILSQTVASATVAIPASVTGNYKISVYCSAGNTTIKTNSASAVARVLGTGMTWEAICLSRTIDSLIFTGGTAYLTVEKI